MTRSFACFTVAFTLFAFSPAARPQEPSAPPGDVLTLERAVSLALETNRLVRNAALEVRKSGRQIAAARTRYMPIFDLTVLGSQLVTPVDFKFKQGVFGEFPATGPIPGADTNITTPRRPTAIVWGSVAQPLSQLYRIGLGVEVAKVGQQISREKLRTQQHSVINEVKRVYYAVLQTESGLEATEESLKFYRELDRVVEQYVLQKVALKAESLGVRARLANQEYEALTLRHQSATLKENLNRLLGRDIRTEFVVRQVPEATLEELDLSLARAYGLERRPELREARLKVEQAQLDWRIKKSEYIPDVSFTVNYLSPFHVELLPSNIVSAGVQVTWEPFDWGRKKQELAEKSRTIEQARNGSSEAESQVLVDVSNRFRRLQETRVMLRVSQLQASAARESLRNVMDSYAQQAALLKDTLEAQAQLAAANDQNQQALLGFWTAKADFEKAIGEEP